MTENGPYLVTGGVPLTEEILTFGENGNQFVVSRHFPEMETYALCRCGHSRNMPYCDGTHAKTGFDGAETASRDHFDERAVRIEGPDLVLADDRPLCALIRFCHQAHGDAWCLTRQSDDPRLKAEAIQAACQCASGRLLAYEKDTKDAIEPELSPSIALLQDPQEACSGPIYVKGGIPVESADGYAYEVRNRTTLCRCGESDNKPFCDASHLAAGFSDKPE